MFGSNCCIQIQILLLLLAVAPTVKSIWFDLPYRGTKCVSEDIRTGIVVLADYYVLPGDNDHLHSNFSIPAVTVKVTSPYGNNVHHQENVTHGQFAFTTSEGGNYWACFSMSGDQEGDGKNITVGIDWKTGIAAKDWDTVARKEKIEGLELELRKLEGAVAAIRENLIYLKGREAEMREVSERTNAKVARFSIMSIGVCMVASLVQVVYLKQFFRKRKLI